ncbi:MAG: hypothetical protein ACHQ4H_02470 [Ktedonobacterales bacterium]
MRMLAYEIIRHSGKLLKHAVGVLLLAWRRVLRAAGIALVVGIVVAEIAGCLATHQFPPSPLTDVAAAIFGVAVAYGVALTVFLDELLLGALDMLRVAEGDIEAGARAAAIAAEREVGDVKSGLLRMLSALPLASVVAPLALGRAAAGPRPATSVSRPLARTLGQFPMPRAITGAPQLSPQSSFGRMPVARDETRDDIAATDAFNNTAPQSQVRPRPVPAAQLPRIGWAVDHLAETAAAALLGKALVAHERLPVTSPAPAGMPPLPLRPAAARAAEAAPPPVPAASQLALPAIARPEPRPSSPVRTVPVVTDEQLQIAAAAAEQSAVAPQGEAEQGEAPRETWTPPTSMTVLPAESKRAAASHPQPGQDDGHPPEGAGERGLFSRITQALAGNTRPLAHDPGDDGAAPSGDQPAL